MPAALLAWVCKKAGVLNFSHPTESEAKRMSAIAPAHQSIQPAQGNAGISERSAAAKNTKSAMLSSAAPRGLAHWYFRAM